MNTLLCTFEEIQSGIGCVCLSGRLDVSGVSEIELKFTVYTSTRRKPVIVDLSQVTLITSMGLGMLLTNARTLRSHGIRMILLKPQPHVEKVISMAAIGDFLPIEHEFSNALERASSRIEN
jgi:anti-sigma B factor antagonist